MGVNQAFWNELMKGVGSDGLPEAVNVDNGAINVAIGSAGGSGAVTTLLNAKATTGAGATFNGQGGRATFHAVANGTSGAFSATVLVQVSNDGTNWELLGTITLSGTATTADSDGFASDAPWAYVRGHVNAISGTGAAVSLFMGV